MNRVTSVLKILIFIVFGASAQLLNYDESGMEFCEGSKNYFSLLRSTCPFGFNFGNKRPDCICLKGIYRLFMSNCEISDGFAADVCMKPYNFNNATNETVAIFSVQTLSEPDWDQSHIVIETVEKSGTWSVLNSKNTDAESTYSSTSDYFYTINGRAFISPPTPDNKQEICFEPFFYQSGGDLDVADSLENPICKISREDNNDIWLATSEQVNIAIARGSECQLTKEKMVELKSGGNCYRPLEESDSECSMKCPRDPMANMPLNCTAGKEMLFYDNEYLDRMMQQYALKSQLADMGQTPKNNSYLDVLEPNRTMSLYKLLFESTLKFCPDAYIPDTWLSYIIDLFYILHKGREFKYSESLSEEEYLWAKDILEDCLAKDYRVRLTSMIERDNSSNSMLECTNDADGGLAKGYCKWEDEECENATRVFPAREKSSRKLERVHLVPETAWNILDAAHGICFREFNDSYRIFHIMEQAVEKLFTNQIKNLWFNPPYLLKPKFKTRLVGKGAELYSKNLEICIASAYDIINKENQKAIGPLATKFARLIRPSPGTFLKRKKRSLESVGKSTEVFCATKSSEFHEPPNCKKSIE